MSFSKATVTGTVQTEPEKRFTPNNTAVTNFLIQVPASTKNEAPFQVRVTCWRMLAEAATQLNKGETIVVDGRLQVNQYENTSGLTKRMYEIDAQALYRGQLQPLLGETGPDTSPASYINQPAGQPAVQYQQPAYASPPQPVAPTVSATANNQQAPYYPQEILTEDDIPF